MISALTMEYSGSALGATRYSGRTDLQLYAALTGERPPFIDADDASIQLSSRLDQKNCLLVIDDVWDANHLKPFLWVADNAHV